MATVNVNGFAMYYESRGEGEPLLLLHGGMGIGADWQHVFPSDPPGYRVIVPDLRGHGRSTNPGGVFTFRRCAADVIALLDHLRVNRVKAIGMSNGLLRQVYLAEATLIGLLGLGGGCDIISAYAVSRLLPAALLGEAAYGNTKKREEKALVPISAHIFRVPDGPPVAL